MTFVHNAELRGATSDHPPRPAPPDQVTDPVIECDFCSRPEATWAYHCDRAELHTDTRTVTSRTVAAQDYRDHHHAARSLHETTTPGPTHRWGQEWLSCDGCAGFLDKRDLYGLISRVIDAMPRQLTRGKRLARTRAELNTTYTTVLATLAPGRDPITPPGRREPPSPCPPRTERGVR